MRLWSLHPKYLDAIGLVALWREGLLAKKVLEGKTKGYKNHPQLERFKQSKKSLDAINHYLCHVWKEALERNYSFDETKLIHNSFSGKIKVTKVQVEFEFNHLQKKLEKRNPKKFIENKKQISKEKIFTNPIFEIIDGPIEKWEKI
jgi:hypothetical protein